MNTGIIQKAGFNTEIYMPIVCVLQASVSFEKPTRIKNVIKWFDEKS